MSKITIGTAIKVCRKDNGQTQDKLSLLSGITKSYLSLIENNKRDPTISTLNKISKGLDVPLFYLLFIVADGKDKSFIGDRLVNDLSEVYLDKFL